MRVMQISKPGGPFELVERPLPVPGRGEVCIKVEACGICHSDSLVKEGHWPGITYPRVPGHEYVGTIDSVGQDVVDMSKGTRVGVGWYGGHCWHCPSCRSGNFMMCSNGVITGIHRDGGYGEYVLASAAGVGARYRSGLSLAVDGGPLMCTAGCGDHDV